MLKGLVTKLPTKEDLLNSKITIKIESNADLLNDSPRDFKDLQLFIETYGLSDDQCDGLLEYLNNRYPEEGYPKFASELLPLNDPLSQRIPNYDTQEDDEDFLPIFEPSKWDGFSKLYDPNLRRNIGQCHGCCALIKNTSRLEKHRSKCGESHGQTIMEVKPKCKFKRRISNGDTTQSADVAQACLEVQISHDDDPKDQWVSMSAAETHELTTDLPLAKKRKLNWNGFSKFFHPEMGRNVAQCNTCGGLLKNTSRIEMHRLKCHSLPTENDQSSLSISTVKLDGNTNLCDSCGVIVDDGIEDHRCNCEKVQQRQPGLRRRLDWQGFSKVFDERLKRMVAACDNCGVVLKNTSRIENHRSRCQMQQYEDV